MLIRSTLLAATLSLAPLGTVHADSVQPMHAQTIDLGEVTGVAYYTVEERWLPCRHDPRAGRERNAGARCEQSRPWPEHRAVHGARNRRRSGRDRDQPSRPTPCWSARRQQLRTDLRGTCQWTPSATTARRPQTGTLPVSRPWLCWPIRSGAASMAQWRTGRGRRCAGSATRSRSRTSIASASTRSRIGATLRA